MSADQLSEEQVRNLTQYADLMEDVADSAAGDSNWPSYVIEKHWDGIGAANGDAWIA